MPNSPSLLILVLIYGIYTLLLFCTKYFVNNVSPAQLEKLIASMFYLWIISKLMRVIWKWVELICVIFVPCLTNTHMGFPSGLLLDVNPLDISFVCLFLLLEWRWDGFWTDSSNFFPPNFEYKWYSNVTCHKFLDSINHTIPNKDNVLNKEFSW